MSPLQHSPIPSTSKTNYTFRLPYYAITLPLTGNIDGRTRIHFLPPLTPTADIPVDPFHRPRILVTHDCTLSRRSSLDVVWALVVLRTDVRTVRRAYVCSRAAPVVPPAGPHGRLLHRGLHHQGEGAPAQRHGGVPPDQLHGEWKCCVTLLNHIFLLLIVRINLRET